jgi:hypothetical protein
MRRFLLQPGWVVGLCVISWGAGRLLAKLLKVGRGGLSWLLVGLTSRLGCWLCIHCSHLP